MLDLEKILISPDYSIKEVINSMQTGSQKILLVIDKEKKLLGTITDGDIRRGLINSFDLDIFARNIMNPNPVAFNEKADKKEIFKAMKIHDIEHIPLLDDKGVLMRLETLNHINFETKKNNPILIMAGGFGNRLRPLTDKIPKPLLRVGNKPILETILERFIDSGFHDFYISTHYKAEQIISYFGNGLRFGVSIQYIHEDIPLGTCGALGLLPEGISDLPLIVINADILSEVDFNNLLEFHNKTNSDATVCVRDFEFQLPYGVITTKNKQISEIREKPVIKHNVNAGIYVISKKLYSSIEKNVYKDITDFLRENIDIAKISAFPIYEYWIDIGRMEDFHKANSELCENFNSRS